MAIRCIYVCSKVVPYVLFPFSGPFKSPRPCTVPILFFPLPSQRPLVFMGPRDRYVLRDVRCEEGDDGKAAYFKNRAGNLQKKRYGLKDGEKSYDV